MAKNELKFIMNYKNILKNKLEKNLNLKKYFLG
jgi:hypothetical protein